MSTIVHDIEYIYTLRNNIREPKIPNAILKSIQNIHTVLSKSQNGWKKVEWRSSPVVEQNVQVQQQAFGNNNKKATDPAEIKVFTAYYAERLQLISDNLVAVKAIIHAKYPDVDLSNATAEQISWTFITGDRAEQCLPVIDSMAYVFKDSLAESVPLEISANSLLFMHKKLAIQRPFEISSRMLPFPAAPSDGVVQARVPPITDLYNVEIPS